VSALTDWIAAAKARLNPRLSGSPGHAMCERDLARALALLECAQAALININLAGCKADAKKAERAMDALHALARGEP